MWYLWAKNSLHTQQNDTHECYANEDKAVLNNNSWAKGEKCEIYAQFVNTVYFGRTKVWWTKKAIVKHNEER